MKKTCILLFISSLFFACQEEVILDLDQKEGRIPVIEGYWTYQGNSNEVKISLAKNYYDSLDQESVRDAEVFVR